MFESSLWDEDDAANNGLDPLSTFYQSCISMLLEQPHLPLADANSSADHETEPVADSDAAMGAGSKRKRRAEKGDNVTVQDLREHFHLPLKIAAERHGMSGSTLKRICRRLGIGQWPYAKIVEAGKRLLGWESLASDIQPSLGVIYREKIHLVHAAIEGLFEEPDSVINYDDFQRDFEAIQVRSMDATERRSSDMNCSSASIMQVSKNNTDH
jgi:RWP-RK domain